MFGSSLNLNGEISSSPSTYHSPQDMKLSNLISPLPPQPSHIWHLVMSVSAIYIMIIKANSHLPIGIGNVIRSLEALSLSTIMSELYRPFNQLVSSRRRAK